MASRPNVEKPLPQNLDAERSVLGAILVGGHDTETRTNAIIAAGKLLHSTDFLLSQHERIFRSMLELAISAQPIDTVTLCEKLHSAGELEAAGGAPYLSSLSDGMPRISNVTHYAKIVAEKAKLRSVIHTTHHIQQRAFESDAVSAELLGTLETFVKNGSNGHARSNPLIAVDVLDFLEMKLDPIDFIFEPILPLRNSMMMFSPAGAGKTYIALYMNYCLAIGIPQALVWDIPKARPAVYVDGEMDEVTLQDRVTEIAKAFYPVKPERNFLKIITPDQQPKDPPRINTKDGRSRIEDHLTEGCLLTLDNLFTLCPGGDNKETEDWAIIQEWIQFLRKKNVAVIVVQHANVSGERQHGTSKREVQLACNLMLRLASDYSPEKGLQVEARLKKLRRRGKDGHWDPRWAQPFEISYRVVDGVAEFSTRPMLEILKQKALELLIAGAHPKEVMESTGLDRFAVYRLRTKLRTDGAAAAAGQDA